MDKNFNK